MSDSTFLDTINALVAACVASPSLAGIGISDGPSPIQTANTSRLFVGMAPDGTSAQGDNVPTGLPGVIDADVFTIFCIAESWAGSTNIPAVRTQAFAVRAVVRNLIRPNPAGITLGVSSLASARLGAWQLDQKQGDKGAFVSFTFRVECESRPSVN